METKPLPERERINQLTFYLNISIRQLAKIVGMNENTFYHISDNSRFGITEKTATKICNNLKKKVGLNVNRDWLLTGEGEMILEELPPKTIEAKPVEKTTEQDIDWREKYYSLLEKYVKLQERRIAILEKNK